MCELKIEAGKKYKTRNGKIVSDLVWDADFGIWRGMKDSCAVHRYKNGKASGYLAPDRDDLVEEIREPRTFYVNEYEDGILGRLVYEKDKIDLGFKARPDFVRTIKLVEVLE